MDLETKLELIKRPPTEEIITEEELRTLLETKEHPKHYIGYEISGLLHLGSLVLSGFKLQDFIKAGLDCTFFMADWHSWINKKLGGDLEKIRKALEYYKEAFKFFVGPKLKFVLGTELYHNNDEYWNKLILINKAVTLDRVKRCLTIMGRKESEKLDFAQLIYPSLQADDIFEMGLDIVHSGMDQRKAHILAREVAQKLKWKVPVAVHHHLIVGLIEPKKEGYDENPEMDMKISSKMSKSKPWTAIFIHDSDEQIKEKLNKAWCPEKIVQNNPILELVKYIIFREKKTFELERPTKFGGKVEFRNYEELEKVYRDGKIHPQDLKENVAREISEIIKPVRKHFEKPANKKLLEVFKETEITR
jgi:tyrosyl-tRNA synthetase